MKVLKILNLCFLCMAVSVATVTLLLHKPAPLSPSFMAPQFLTQAEIGTMRKISPSSHLTLNLSAKADNETTTITSVLQENNSTTTTTESTTQKVSDGEQRRFWPSPGGENFIDSTGFHFNGISNNFPAFPTDEMVEPEPDPLPLSYPSSVDKGFSLENLFSSLPPQTDPMSNWQIPKDDSDNILHSLTAPDISSSGKLSGLDFAVLSSSEKESIKMLYSTEMPPILSQTPCDNSNALTNILNNLLGLLLSQMGEAPNDVNVVIDSINTSIESNPKGLFDTKLYPVLRSMQEKTSAGALNLQNRLKRDLKSKIIFKKEIPRINEPDCKTAFLKLMALAYKSYIEASKLPDCKIRNHIIPDNPYNPSKVIIPSFEQGLVDVSQSKNLYENSYKSPLSLDQSTNSKGIKFNIKGNSETITHKNITNVSNGSVRTNEGDQLMKNLVASLLRSDKKQSQILPLRSASNHQRFEEQIDNDLLALLSHTTAKPQPPLTLPTNKADTSIFGLNKSWSNLHEQFPLKLTETNEYRSSLTPDTEKSHSFADFLQSSLKQNDLKSDTLRSGSEVIKPVPLFPLKFDFMNSTTPKDNHVNYSKTEFLRTLKDALSDLDTKVESSPEENIMNVISNSQTLPQNNSQTQLNLNWIAKSLDSVAASKVLKPESWEKSSWSDKKTLITHSSNLGSSDQHHFALPEVKLSVVKGTIPLDNKQDLEKTTKSPIDWLRLIQSAGLKKSSNNNSDTEKGQIRNNRSVALRDNTVDVNFINNQLSDALRSKYLPQGGGNFFQEGTGSVSNEPSSLHLNANAILNNPKYRTLSPRAKVAVIKDLLEQYGKSKDFKPGGNLGLLAFWHTNPNNSKIPQVIQKNNINIYITPNRNTLTPGQKLETLQTLGALYPHENPEYVKLLQSILAYVKHLANKPNRDDENAELLNNIHSMVSQLVTNPELRQNIVVLLRVYVNWASQLGVDWTMGKNINQLLEHIKNNLVNGNNDNSPNPALDSQSVVNLIIQYLRNAIKKLLPNLTDQQIAINQLDHAIIYATEHGVDLTKPENLNELLSYLKEIIKRIQNPDISVDNTDISVDDVVAPTQNTLDLSILTDIAHMLKDLQLSTEERIYIIRKVRDYINNAKQEGIDLKNPENWKQLVLFVKTIVNTILSKGLDNYDPFSIDMPVTEPAFTIPDDINVQYVDDLRPTLPSNSISPNVLENLYTFIDNAVSNTKDKEEVMKLLESYLNNAANSGIDLNSPENLNNLIVYLNSVILQIEKSDSSFEPPTSPSSTELLVNPAVIKYISQLIYNLVNDSDQRQIVTAQAGNLIKSYVVNGVDLAVKANLNKLIWDVVNIIKTVVNGASIDVPNSPVHQQVEPEAIEIVYRFKQKILIKGLKDPAKPQNSYVKYRVPYDVFTGNLRDLLLRTPALRSDPDRLMKELEETTNITEVSPELQGLPKSHLINLLTHDGSFVDAKVPTDTKRSNLRSAADLEMAVDFEKKIHDLDSIINNNTSVETQTDTTTVAATTESNNIESTTFVGHSNHELNFNPLKFNADNPFYNILNKINNTTNHDDLTRKLAHI